jgi:hypothetical protein
MAAATSFLWVKLMQSRLQGRPQWELKMPCWKCVEGERAEDVELQIRWRMEVVRTARCGRRGRYVAAVR